MKATNFFTSNCRYCRYYKPEGRRGGNCDILQVTVQSSWKACTLAIPPFTYSLKLERVLSIERMKQIEEAEAIATSNNKQAKQLTAAAR